MREHVAHGVDIVRESGMMNQDVIDIVAHHHERFDGPGYPQGLAGDQVPAFEKSMVESGILLLKYWLEVSPEEQTRRLASRIDDGRKIWKLSPMDLKSYDRWDDYTKARDEMFAATDTEWAPWYVARSEDKKRVRLNVISHLLEHVPYKDVKRDKVKLDDLILYSYDQKTEFQIS